MQHEQRVLAGQAEPALDDARGEARAERGPAAIPDRIETPTVLSVFPHDIKPAPRSYAEEFLNVCDYVEHRAGGHFAAWEQPQTYADDVRRAVKLGGWAAATSVAGSTD